MSHDPELNALLAELRENPEKAQTADLSLEQIAALQKKLNPYTRIAGPGRDEKEPHIAAMSYTNMSEDTIRRFTMVSVVAFIYRMFGEWIVKPEKRRWKPAKAQQETSPFDVVDLEIRLDALQELLTHLKEKEQEKKDAIDAQEEYDKTCVFSEEEMEKEKDKIMAAIEKQSQLRKKVAEAEDAFQGFRYMMTLELRTMGIEADLRLRATEKEAMQHPKSKSGIQAMPNRHRGILPGSEQEMPEIMARGIIGEFLDAHFEFNPDAHVRCAYDEVASSVEMREVPGLKGPIPYDIADPKRIPLQQLLEKAPPESNVVTDKEFLELMVYDPSADNRQYNYNTVCRLLQNEPLARIAKYVLADNPEDKDRAERWRRMLLPKLTQEVLGERRPPPQDTFHRFNYYMEVNMEALREATASLFPDGRMIGYDFAIQLMDSTKGSHENVEAWKEKFRTENQDRVISDIKMVEFGAWTFLGDYSANREQITYFNQHTDLIRRIMERHEEDSKFGKLLMKQRVRKVKAENIKQDGPDAVGLSQYKDHAPVDGARPAMSDIERRRLERAKGSLRDARELEYFEQYQKRIRDLEDISRVRELNDDELFELKEARIELKRAAEAIAVPDDAIQVDMWTMSHTTGTATKEKFYTKAVKPGENTEDLELTEANIEMAKRKRLTEQELNDPANFVPESSRDRFREAQAKGQTLPMAKFAQDFLKKENEAAAAKEAAETAHLGPGLLPAASETKPQAMVEPPSGDLAATLDTLLESVAGT